jgi:acyl-coenzyme A thioesterase PaaI-like protein
VAAAATIEYQAFEQGSVSGVATFGPEHEGHASFVHGGAIAATFDQMFGLLWAYAPAARFTRTLSVSYIRPIPIGAETRFEARASELPGRRERIRATATIDGRTVARASALMVQPRPRT